MPRLFAVVSEREHDHPGLVAVFDDAALAHALVQSVSGLHGYSPTLKVWEISLNPQADALRNGERPFSVLVNPPASFNVTRIGGLPEPSCVALRPDANWRFRVTVWAKDEREAEAKALVAVRRHADES